MFRNRSGITRGLTAPTAIVVDLPSIRVVLASKWKDKIMTKILCLVLLVLCAAQLSAAEDPEAVSLDDKQMEMLVRTCKYRIAMNKCIQTTP